MGPRTNGWCGPVHELPPDPELLHHFGFLRRGEVMRDVIAKTETGPPEGLGALHEKQAIEATEELYRRRHAHERLIEEGEGR